MEPIINVKNLSFKYKQSDFNTIDHVSFGINRGEWISIIGRNGSGKSTLVKLIDGLLPFQDGSILIDDIELNDSNLNSIHSKIGFIFQNPDNQIVSSTVEDDIAFGMENHNFSNQEMKELVNEVLQKVGLNGFNKKVPEELSGGQKQRVALAGILAINPKIIILDEATSMIDPVGRKEMLHILKSLNQEKKITIVAITHDADEIKLADRVMIIEQGKIKSISNQQDIFNNLQNMLKMGLDIPNVEKIRLMLRKANFPVPDKYVNEEELVHWITKLLLKK